MIKDKEEQMYYRKSKRQIINKEGWESCKVACTIILLVNWALFLFIGFVGLLPDITIVKHFEFYISLGFGAVMLLILVIGYYATSKRKYEKWSNKRK